MDTKIVRIDYYPEVFTIHVKVPADLAEEDYDEWFDVINSKAELEHRYQVINPRWAVEPDWDLT